MTEAKSALSIFGLGYVGTVSAACFARAGHRVVGVDVNPAKVDALNQGVASIVEEDVTPLVRDVVRDGMLTATTEAAEAVGATDISFLCVGTPSGGAGDLDLQYIRRVCEEIGEILAKTEEPHLVVVRSTVLPGTTEEVVIPTLEARSGRKLGDGLDVCVNPEFLREGSAVRDFLSPPFTVLGPSSDQAFECVAALYRNIEAPLFRTRVPEAEMIKYACNSFHAVKVTFANEIGNVCKALGIDSHAIMDVFCSDEKLNLSSAYLKPGFAFGGSCLPKDLRALLHRARHLDVSTPLLGATVESNRQQVERAARMVLETGEREIGILGLAFKEGTDDLRESPVVRLVEILLGKGMELRVYDPLVSEAGLLGANREFIERQIPHIWTLMREDPAEVVDRSSVVVLGNRTEHFRSLVNTRANGRRIIDLARVFPERISDQDGYEGICW